MLKNNSFLVLSISLISSLSAYACEDKIPVELQGSYAIECLNQARDSVSRKNMQEAASWYKEAADHGLAKAQYQMGLYHVHGTEVKINLQLAIQYFQEAANQIHVKAQYEMSRFYITGIGVIKNREMAIYWLKKVVEQGLSSVYQAAQRDLYCQQGLLSFDPDKYRFKSDSREQNAIQAACDADRVPKAHPDKNKRWWHKSKKKLKNMYQDGLNKPFWFAD